MLQLIRRYVIQQLHNILSTDIYIYSKCCDL